MANKRLSRLLLQVTQHQASVDPEERDLEDAVSRAQKNLNTFLRTEKQWRERWLDRAVPAVKVQVLEWFIEEAKTRRRSYHWDSDLERYQEYLSPKLPSDLVWRAIDALVKEKKLLAEVHDDPGEMCLSTCYYLPNKKK